MAMRVLTAQQNPLLWQPLADKTENSKCLFSYNLSSKQTL